MTDIPWLNPYKELIHSKPELLISCAQKQGPLTEEQKEAIATRLSSYSKIVCELGSGSGSYLIHRAEEAKETLFLGFELRYKRAYRTAEKAEEKGLSNLFVIQGDARRITEIFAPKSLEEVVINFPDPWAKKRWRKHRLLNASLLVELAKLLKPQGLLAYRSDHKEYFEEAVSLVRENRDFLIESVEENPPSGPVQSEFESLFRSKGVDVHELLARAP